MTLKKLALVPLLLSFAFSSSASIQVLGTRVIFNAQQKEETVRINNVGTTPALVQIWLDSRADSKISDKEDLPFMINPPVSRINVGKSKVFRIFQTDEAVNKYPQDRESALWVNILDVPPEGELDANKLNIAVRTRIKFFYRPAGLKGDAITAAESLKWSGRRVAKGYEFTAENNTPFHISIANYKLGDDASTQTTGGMIEPFSKKAFIVKSDKTVANPVLKYNYITDLGAYVAKEYRVSM